MPDLPNQATPSDPLPPPERLEAAERDALKLQDAVREFFHKTREADDITRTVAFAAELQRRFTEALLAAEQRGAAAERKAVAELLLGYMVVDARIKPECENLLNGQLGRAHDAILARASHGAEGGEG